MTWWDFERALARTCLGMSIAAVLAWFGVLFTADIGVWGLILAGISLVMLGYSVVWVRAPLRLRSWSGLALFAVVVGPVTWSRVWHHQEIAQAAQALSIVVMLLAGPMTARKDALTPPPKWMWRSSRRRRP